MEESLAITGEDALRRKGVSDEDTATLEGYGSLAEFIRKPGMAMYRAKAAEIEEILRENGLI